jgi:L-alanine-DL-glutamate epimerase-like enolase superfamily enzyme
MTTDVRIGRFESQMRFRFKHASADRAETQNVIVELRDETGMCGFGEGCPRDYVTGETLDSADAFLAERGREIADVAGDVQTLRAWVDAHEPLIDANPAAFCAIELAALDLIGKREGKTLEALLDSPPLSGPVAYTAVMGDSSPSKTWALSAAYRLWCFSDFKIKLSGILARDQKRLSTLPQHARVRVDANNYWRDAFECIAHLKQLGRPFWAIEEPVAPGDCESMRAIADALGAKIILDESLSRHDQLVHYSEDAERWIANIRVSKCGGVLRSIRLAKHAQNIGHGVILGAHVGETSLLTRAALAVGQALDHAPAGREGAYGDILLKNDLTEPSIRFQHAGKLKLSRLDLSSKPGLGLVVSSGAVNWRKHETRATTWGNSI